MKAALDTVVMFLKKSKDLDSKVPVFKISLSCSDRLHHRTTASRRAPEDSAHTRLINKLFVWRLVSVSDLGGD